MSLHQRIREISKKHNLSHVGSCLTACDIIDEIYQKRKEDEPFILSCGHAGLALYVVLEKYLGKDAEALYLKHGTHPNRDLGDGIYCSTGSLGLGLPIALGMAMADRSKKVWCLISDGEATEGTIWEVARNICRQEVTNLKIYLNYNGWGAYGKVDFALLEDLFLLLPQMEVRRTSVKDHGFEGQEAHYAKL